MTVVVDASVALDWCFKSERTPYANAVLDRVLEAGTVVPSWWAYEVANSFFMARKRGRITPAGLTQAQSLLRSLAIEVAQRDAHDELGRLVDLGERFGLTAYDSAYLLPAMETGYLLATNDAALKTAAGASGVTCFVAP